MSNNYRKGLLTVKMIISSNPKVTWNSIIVCGHYVHITNDVNNIRAAMTYRIKNLNILKISIPIFHSPTEIKLIALSKAKSKTQRYLNQPVFGFLLQNWQDPFIYIASNYTFA